MPVHFMYETPWSLSEGVEGYLTTVKGNYVVEPGNTKSCSPTWDTCDID